MTATASFEGVRLKLARARKHFAELDTALRAYNASNPYEIVVQDNPQSGRREHMVTRVTPLPAETSVMVGDVVHNLRSALDHVIWQLVIANGCQPILLRPAFPIWNSETACTASWPGAAAGISDQALTLLQTLKPYKGGNDRLWRLHQLDIIDKHRLHLRVLATQRDVMLDMTNTLKEAIAKNTDMEEGRRRAWADKLPSMPMALKAAEPEVMREGAVVFAGPIGDTSQDDAKFTIEIGLDEPGIVEGELPGPMLEQLGGMVTGIVQVFEPLIGAS